MFTFCVSVIFETLAIYTGSKKHVDSIYVYVKILKYLQHKLGTAENCIITHASSLCHINVSYCTESKLQIDLVFDEKRYSLNNFEYIRLTR